MNKQKREELNRKIAEEKRKKEIADHPVMKAIDKAISLTDDIAKAIDNEPGKPSAREVATLIKSDACVTYTCGHKVGIAQLEKIACPGCVAANKRARWERKKAAQAKRIEAVPVDSFRLPDGSVYTKCYSASTKTWSASLCVLINGKPKTFTAFGPASFKVECELDRVYRESLKESDRAAEIEEQTR